MDADLKRLADAGLLMEQAEAASADGATQGAQDAIDRVDPLLAGLRERWPELSTAERRIVGPAARTIRERRDTVAARVPRHRALTAVPEEADAEQEEDPTDHEGDGRG